METAVEIKLLPVGSCSAPAFLAGGKGLQRLPFPALVAWLRHPSAGEILFDTGYSGLGIRLMKRLPSLLLWAMLRPQLPPEEELSARLMQAGTHLESIRTVFISHFHTDHAAGLRTLPNVDFIASKCAWEAAKHIPWYSEGRAAFSSQLIPEGFEQRTRWLLPENAAPWEGFPATWDLFGDGSLRAIDLPGHAPGQAGLFVESTSGPVLLAADAIWLRENLAGSLPPRWLLRLAQHDHTAWLETVERLRTFSKAHPEVAIVPSHCLSSLQGPAPK